MDIFSSLAIMYSIYVSLKKPDREHQFGHSAAQPLAAFIIALFACVLGIQLIEECIRRLISPNIINVDYSIYLIFGTTIVIKIFLSQYQKKIGIEFKSTAIRASAIDSLNDVLTSSFVVIGIACVQFGFLFIDSVAGIVISFFIFRAGYKIARENIDYLMGKAADDKMLIEIANKALKIDGVQGLNELRSHYVGDKFHIEIHINVDKNLNTENSHNIGLEVQREILKIEEINKVYVHIDPV